MASNETAAEREKTLRNERGGGLRNQREGRESAVKSQKKDRAVRKEPEEDGSQLGQTGHRTPQPLWVSRKVTVVAPRGRNPHRDLLKWGFVYLENREGKL